MRQLRHSGIKVRYTLMSAALISGALAGLAGVSEVAGLKGYLTSDLSQGLDMRIVVAMLAGLSPQVWLWRPIYCVGLCWRNSMSRAVGVSSYLADLVVATALLCVLLGGFLARFKVVRVKSARSLQP